MNTILNQIRVAAVMLLVLTVLTGLAYPLLTTGIAQVAFHKRANGSLIVRNGKVVGSELIGQPFDDPKYFWSRPSATTPLAYNAAASAGSNLAVANPAELDAIRQRVAVLRTVDPQNTTLIPVDLVTASASGLDPHISVAAAQYQVPRVARARQMSEAAVRQLVDKYTEGRQFGLIGEPRVNVLRLNLALDEAGVDGAPPEER